MKRLLRRLAYLILDIEAKLAVSGGLSNNAEWCELSKRSAIGKVLKDMEGR